MTPTGPKPDKKNTPQKKRKAVTTKGYPFSFLQVYRQLSSVQFFAIGHEAVSPNRNNNTDHERGYPVDSSDDPADLDSV